MAVASVDNCRNNQFLFRIECPHWTENVAESEIDESDRQDLHHWPPSFAWNDWATNRSHEVDDENDRQDLRRWPSSSAWIDWVTTPHHEPLGYAWIDWVTNYYCREESSVAWIDFAPATRRDEGHHRMESVAEAEFHY